MERKFRRGMSGDGSVDDGETDSLPAIEQQIDENLRLIYRQCLEEGIPPEMQALIDQLHDETSRLGKRAGGGDSQDRS